MELGLDISHQNHAYANEINVIDWPSAFNRAKDLVVIQGALVTKITDAVEAAIADQAYAITSLRN
jgi:hypothetical protein